MSDINIFHITYKKDWENALQTGQYTADSLNEEGFIHCSTIEQVAGSANNYFVGQKELIVLQIDPIKVNAKIKYENLIGGKDLFPHIYGILDVNAVKKILPLILNSDGIFEFDQAI
ncbi:MAG: DUF952 domain-containing protein [Anaerolineaceae bacterium]|nr:DUF952 domain-containing protein [Anaerolineaceae bacterium]